MGSQEAGSLSHNRNAIDIYSNSWGPTDYGFVVIGPDQIVQEAFETGANEVYKIIIINIFILRKPNARPA